jgi:hypothetical protein
MGKGGEALGFRAKKSSLFVDSNEEEDTRKAKKEKKGREQ